MLKVENTIIEPSKIFVNDNFKIRIKVISVENTKYLITENNKKVITENGKKIKLVVS